MINIGIFRKNLSNRENSLLFGYAKRNQAYPHDIIVNACIAFSRGCEWCSTYGSGYPYCFYNTKPGWDGTCDSTIAPGDRQDCWPYPEGSNAKCVNAGCTWCPLDGYAWCFYDNNPVRSVNYL